MCTPKSDIPPDYHLRAYGVIMRSRTLLKLTLPYALLLLTACSTLIPTNQYQGQIESDIAQVENWQTLTNSADVSYLNDLFNSTDVDSLLKQAFSDNPSFQQIMLTLDIRRAQFKQATAEQRPQISAGLSNTRKENTDNSYNGSLMVSWQSDLWGKLKDSTNAAEIDIAEQEILVQSARNTLGTDILHQWLELISQKQAIVI